MRVLNLIINGLPSKLCSGGGIVGKWKYTVLNLIINGLPSKLKEYKSSVLIVCKVLNLIINGLPSKH